jgi:hypothetical protein
MGRGLMFHNLILILMASKSNPITIVEVMKFALSCVLLLALEFNQKYF